MSANLSERRRQFKSRQFRVSRPVIDRRKQQERIQPYPLPPVTDDEEMKFVARAVIWMVVLGVTPLILFYTISFFYPGFLWIPIAPN